MNSVKDLTVALFNSDARFSEWRKDGQCTDLCASACYYLPDKAWGSYSLMNNRSGYGSANTWYEHWNGQKGSEPKVGSIICWSVSDSGNQYGHVAVVTAVNTDGTIDFVEGYSHKTATQSHYNYHKSNVQGFLYIPNWEEPKPVEPKKSVEEIAKEVIAGKWGNGQDRKTRLTNAGYNYDEVQNKVNELLHPTPSKKSVDEIAREVLDGKWGNGLDRKNKLTAAGYDYEQVQKRVNELC